MCKGFYASTPILTDESTKNREINNLNLTPTWNRQNPNQVPSPVLSASTTKSNNVQANTKKNEPIRNLVLKKNLLTQVQSNNKENTALKVKTINSQQTLTISISKVDKIKTEQEVIVLDDSDGK